MRLIHALHKSSIKAAIYALEHHAWNRVVVEWGPHQYTTEIHMYDKKGDLAFQIVGYQKVSENDLRVQLGDGEYFSDKWKPYATPTPAEIQGQRRIIRNKRPADKKKFYPADDGTIEYLLR